MSETTNLERAIYERFLKQHGALREVARLREVLVDADTHLYSLVNGVDGTSWREVQASIDALRARLSGVLNPKQTEPSNG